MNLNQFATQVASKSKKVEKSFVEVNAFLGVCKEQGLRINYGALTTLCLHLQLVEPSNFNIHQRGASLVKKLDADVQPFVCRKNGSYDVSAITWDANLAKQLRQAAVISEENVVAAFESTKTAKAEEKKAE
jgi:hypothetical protein